MRTSRPSRSSQATIKQRETLEGVNASQLGCVSDGRPRGPAGTGNKASASILHLKKKMTCGNNEQSRRKRIPHKGCLYNKFINFLEILGHTHQKKEKQQLQIPLVPARKEHTSYKALVVEQKAPSTSKSSYQRFDPVLLLHLLPQLLEAGLQAVVERPQRLRDLLSVDANTFGEVWDLPRRNVHVRHIHPEQNPGERSG